MEIKVPFEKSENYPQYLLNSLSECITTLLQETKQWPDSLIFTGAPGKEIFDIINNLKWDFSKFKIEYRPSTREELIIQYQNPINITDDVGTQNADTLDGRIIDGIPGPETMSKIAGHYSSVSYSINKNIEPSIIVKLVR